MFLFQCMRSHLDGFWPRSAATWKSCMTSAGPKMIRDFCLPLLMELSGEPFFVCLRSLCLSAECVRLPHSFSLSPLVTSEWNVERLLRSAQKVLPHPSFVYCAQYHPAAQNLVVTGGFDALLRVWRVDVDDVNGQLLQELDGHGGFVNTVCFDPEGSEAVSRCWG